VSEPRRPIVLLVNPVSGRKIGSGPPISDDPDELSAGALAGALGGMGVSVASVREPADEEDVARVAAHAMRGGLDVVVAGGDGTVRAAAAALVGGDAALGIIPTGSFNNIARSLALPADLEPALKVIAAGRTSTIDCGAAHRSAADDPVIFFEAAGVGLDAATFGAAELVERRGLRHGLRLLWRALRWRRRRMVVELDGRRTVTSALLVTVSNGPYYGFGFTVAAHADLTDGRFEVSIFRRMSRWDLIRHFAAVARGRRRYEPRIRTERAARVGIEGLRRSIPVHADGEVIGITPVRFEVWPAALRVFR
jgi:diacylglycerol kinase (ATP)